MKKRNLKPVMENVKRRWTRQIVQEKGYTQTTAIWMVERIEELIDMDAIWVCGDCLPQGY